MPIALPGPDAAPAGPRRDLVVHLHDLYGRAGKPATRIISKRITMLRIAGLRNNDERADLETVSHETINSVLRAKSVPSWAKLKSIIVALCSMSEQDVDVRQKLVELNATWIRATSLPESVDERAPRPQLVGRPPSAELPPPFRPPGPVARIRVHGELPARAALFTGREHVLDEIEDRLRRSPETPLVLHGPIGAGKTQLAAEYVRQHRDDYAITWWVRAGSLEAARDSLLRLADRLGVAGQRPFDELLVALARSGPYLLVFDGVVSGDIRALIRMRGGTVLVTTRNTGWAHESLHDRFEVPDLDEGEAAQLLRKQDAHMTRSQISHVTAVTGRSPLGLVEACRLYEERATSWEDVADRLAAPGSRVLTDPRRPARDEIEQVRSILRGRLSAEPELLPLLTLLLGFGPSPVWLWMLQAGADTDVSAAARHVLSDASALKRTLYTLVSIGFARGEADWVAIPAIVRLVLRELVPGSWGEVNRRDVVQILIRADPAHPEDRKTAARHRAITPHLQPAALVESLRPSAYRTLHHQIRFLFLAGDLRSAQRLGSDAEEALRRQKMLAPTDELVLQIRRDLANALRADGRYPEAYRLTGEAMASIDEDPAYLPDHVIALDLARSRGHDLRLMGRYREAYELDELTHARHARVFAAEDDLRLLASRYNLSVSRRFLGRYREAADADRADLDRLSGDRSGDDRRRSRLANALAEDLYGLGRHEEVVDLLAPLVESANGRELQRARRMTGVAFRRLGQLVPAVEQLGVCYHACLNQPGARRELTLAVCMSYGNALRALGQYDTALHYCLQAVKGYAAALDERNPLVRAAQVNTAAVHLAQGQVDEAEVLLDEAYDELAGQFGERHPFTVLAMINRATAVAMVDPVSAWSWSSRAYALAREVFGPDHLDTLLAAAGFAADRAARNEEDDTAPSLDEVLAALRRRFGPGHSLVTQVADGSRAVVDIEVPSA
ncbi:FxSxx-COOH system tetratricopeptide repeat protein [Actinoplanes sp. URMC 104]|uniref:FxSxx-COOH system tetratricopeptide repeat protein n=1 Tax=Actinoplanes sp. URMC 104 TaxID=3423409 RepID=UPI003F1C5196